MGRARKDALRQGIGAALATTAASADWRQPVISDRDAVQTVLVQAVAPNADQPRRIFPRKAMYDLRESIRQHGVLSPILVRPWDGGDGIRYQIVAGERRWRASRELELQTIPAVVRSDIDDRAAIELALVENLQRHTIDPMEEARALQALLRLGYSQEEIARRLSKSPAHVSERLRLTTLPESVQELVLEGRLSSSVARNLARIGDGDRQRLVVQRLVSERFTVRQVEAMMRQLRADATQPPLAELGATPDLTPLVSRVTALVAATRALPTGLDAASQAVVRTALAPLATLLAEWQVGAPGDTRPDRGFER